MTPHLHVLKPFHVSVQIWNAQMLIVLRLSYEQKFESVRATQSLIRRPLPHLISCADICNYIVLNKVTNNVVSNTALSRTNNELNLESVTTRSRCHAISSLIVLKSYNRATHHIKHSMLPWYSLRVVQNAQIWCIECCAVILWRLILKDHCTLIQMPAAVNIQGCLVNNNSLGF